MKRPGATSKVLAFFALLLVIDWALYFRHVAHFFQGDTIFLINHRATSFSGYWTEFTALNPSGWYRPLANELLESILYPWAGLNPIPYRIPVYLVFIAITVAVYALGFALTRRHLVAALTTLFFTIHTTNAYTTFDLGFMPELLYAFFYLAATLAFLRYLETESKVAYGLSLVCFAGSLLSKEAAVTLPGTLFVTAIVMGRPFSRTVRSIVPHAALLVLYLAIAVGYLNVQTFSVRKLLDPSLKPNPGDYIPVLNRDVFKNADVALSWAFNIPRGGAAQSQDLWPRMVLYLKVFRAIVLVLMTIALIKSDRRRTIVFGILWFWITLLPALPLVAHFLQYYLFVPTVGLALVVGVSFAWLYDRLSRLQTAVAATVVVCAFGGLLYVTSRSIRAQIRDNWLLGGSARMASNTLSDLKRLYPTLPDKPVLFFFDAGQPLLWHHDSGGLIRMAYGRNDISALYETQEGSIPEIPNAFVFRVENGRLADLTTAYQRNPLMFAKFKPSDLRLSLSTAKVAAGRDKYTLSIPRLGKAALRVAYTVDGGPLETFGTILDADGKVTFEVSPYTKRGVYRFEAFKVAGGIEWIRAGETLTVY